MLVPLCLCLISVLTNQLGEALDRNSLPFIKGFGQLQYARKHRLKRDASNRHSVSISYRRKRFTLQLWDDHQSAFSPNFQLELNHRVVDSSDLPVFVAGKVEGDPLSHAYGSLIDGIFDGHVVTGTGQTYHIEKATKYFNDSADLNFHSIVYSDDDIDDSTLPVRIKRSPSPNALPHCGLNENVRRWMDDVQTSPADQQSNFIEQIVYDSQPETHDRESEAAKWLHPSRLKRQIADERDKETGFFPGRTCSLYVQSDQKLYEHIYKNEGQQSEKRTQEEIIALINNHVKAVNAIYENTDFEGLKGFNFVVQRVTIYDSKSCENVNEAERDSGNPFCIENVDVSNFLNRNSMRNHSDFCLAYALTFRDFDGGTLGLAWVASPQASIRGGICEVYQQYTEGSRHVKRSLNTGIITLVNYNNRVPPKVSQLTLAHEIGHNFGSPHDFPTQCVPGVPDGNFIMFASATSGDKPNNARFSPCSIRNISSVLKSVLSSPPSSVGNLYGSKRNCFTARKGPFCGNQLVEEGEECDCGFNDEECRHRGDNCCVPRVNDLKEQGCKLRPNMACSPSQGPCCSDSCQHTTSQSQVECRIGSDCTEPQWCDGRGPYCPPSLPKKTSQSGPLVCADNTKLCRDVTCNGSICEAINMEECFLTDPDNLVKCHLACMPRGGDPKRDCLSSFKLQSLQQYYQQKTGNRGILLRPGSPCNNFMGYCDVFHKCRSVDSNGPLSRLKDLFSPEALETVADWIQRYWWAVVLMGLALVLVMALFIKCCAVHTPSSNPRKPPAQSIYETLRHPTTLVRRQGRSRGGGGGNGGPRSVPPANPNAAAQNRRPRSRSRRDPATNGLAGASVNTEQPPPYSAVVGVEAAAAVGPARGHRRNKKTPTPSMEMRTRRV